MVAFHWSAPLRIHVVLSLNLGSETGYSKVFPHFSVSPKRCCEVSLKPSISSYQRLESQWRSRQEGEIGEEGVDVCLLNETRLESNRALRFANSLPPTRGEGTAKLCRGDLFVHIHQLREDIQATAANRPDFPPVQANYRKLAFLPGANHLIISSLPNARNVRVSWHADWSGPGRMFDPEQGLTGGCHPRVSRKKRPSQLRFP